MANADLKTRYRGLAVVEAAVILPVLLLLTFGVMEYGWLFLKAEQVNLAARAAARTAVVAGSTTAEVQAEAADVMTRSGMGDSGYVLTISPADVSNVRPHETIEVEITVPYDNVRLLGVPLIPGPPSIRGSVTMAKEGP